MLEFLTTPLFGTATWLWLAFLFIVLALLILDLGVLHRDQHEIEMRESLLLYSGYFSVGVLFGLWVWFELGEQSALEFYTGFLVEQSLSMDNVFVMAMIFGAFAHPAPLSASRAVLGHPRGDRAARDHDRPGRGPGGRIRLGALPVRRLPALTGSEDASCGRTTAAPGHREHRFARFARKHIRVTDTACTAAFSCAESRSGQGAAALRDAAAALAW